jgi:peptide-N4-(N-acetyl-beta-glucosaminyl)asparagine amidase
LKERATENLRKIQKLILANKYKDEEPRMELLVLMELARWFKDSFFRWINKLPCKVCGNEDTNLVGTKSQNGVRVEIYTCPQPACRNPSMEFYRYNDVAKLLVTRGGRCGEWANCFTFLCRAMGYDARYVYASFDHVWTEVYDLVGKRWIHVDSCENVFDSPLMYQHGWKRSVAYTLAFARDDVQDVTPRYSNQMEATLQLRTSCTERELLGAVTALRGKRQAECTPVRKKFLVDRTLKELVAFTMQREPTEGELKGRSSGSLAWRLERGEEQTNNVSSRKNAKFS